MNANQATNKPYKCVNPTEEQTYHDIESVYDWCLRTGLVKDASKEIILYGQSVGRYRTKVLSVISWFMS